MHRSTSRTVRLLLAGVTGATLLTGSATAQNARPPAEGTSFEDAQTNQADPDPADIVVTARRREETLLDVPIAVSAFTGAQLESGGAIDVTDLAQVVPNVTLEVARGTNSTLSAFIRGVGQQDPVGGFEAGVGIYLDDVYLNRPQGAVLDIYDVERIEVLRGPQGTLYGRNTIGGAVKYVTRRLGDEPTLSLRGTYGSYDQADGVISGSLPIGDGTLKIGGAAARLSRGGFGENVTTGLDNYNKDIWAARATIQLEPSASAFFRLSGDYTDDRSNPRGGHRLIPGLATGVLPLPDVFDSAGGLLDPRQKVEAYGGTLFGELKPSEWLTFRSITAYRRDDTGTPIDFDALPAVQVDVPTIFNNEQFSQEAQLLVDTGGFSGLLGVYYLDAKSRTVFDVRLPGAVTALTFGDVLTNTVAVFGDFTYDLGRLFSVSLGGRYTWDDRRSDILRQTYVGGSSPYFGGGGRLAATTSNFQGSASFEKFTPRASVSFKPGADQLIYASYSKGFKGGGFDPRGQSTACRTPSGSACSPQQVYDFLSFDPETVDSYELGWKGSLFERRLTYALAAFHSDYTDVQIPGSIGTVLNGQQTFIGITTNAGRARIDGIEGEFNLVAARDMAAFGDRLTISSTFGYLDARFKTYIDSRGVNVADRRRFQNTPDWTASGTVDYRIPVGTGSVQASTTVSYRSSSQQFELRTPLLDQPGFALWDANLNWDIDERYSIGLHARNIADKRYIVSGYTFLSQNPDTGDFLTSPTTGRFIPTLGTEGVLTGFYGSPRQVFATLSAKF